MELHNKKCLVVGAGKSGTAAARFLNERGARVALNDSKPLESWSDEASALKSEGVGLLAGDAPSWLLDQIELVVASPGVPVKSIPIRYAERAGAEVIGEIELAARFLKGRIVAITGSNGKTTTTTLVGELFRQAERRTLVGGNIGTPLVSLVAESNDKTWTVAELSSFQLETTKDFRPHVAAVLNVTPDHMDRYESLTDYAAAKHRIFRNQTAEDFAVINDDDALIASWAQGLSANVIRFSSTRELANGIFLRNGKIVMRHESGERTLHNAKDMRLRGRHNIENVMAAFAIGCAAGLPLESMSETVRAFPPVEHRLELVAKINGVEYYNDSKATNVDAAVKAVEAFADSACKLVLIMGGRGKGAPYAPLAPLLAARARALVTIGEDAPRIHDELGDAVATERADSLADAVRLARTLAQPGDAVLLAPACASFDMFDSYEHRGRVFKEEVEGIKNAK